MLGLQDSGLLALPPQSCDSVVWDDRGESAFSVICPWNFDPINLALRNTARVGTVTRGEAPDSVEVEVDVSVSLY